MSNEKPIYEKIRKIPVYMLLKMEAREIKRFEKNIRREIARAELALRWLQGVKKLKQRNKEEFYGK